MLIIYFDVWIFAYKIRNDTTAKFFSSLALIFINPVRHYFGLLIMEGPRSFKLYPTSLYLQTELHETFFKQLFSFTLPTLLLFPSACRQRDERSLRFSCKSLQYLFPVISVICYPYHSPHDVLCISVKNLWLQYSLRKWHGQELVQEVYFYKTMELDKVNIPQLYKFWTKEVTRTLAWFLVNALKQIKLLHFQ
jgi:hypothetical protein